MNFRKILGNLFKYPRNIYNFIKNSIDIDDKEAIKDFFIDVAIYGSMINLSLFVIGLMQFTWYSWIGLGFAYRILEKKIIKWLRLIIHNS